MLEGAIYGFVAAVVIAAAIGAITHRGRAECPNCGDKFDPSRSHGWLPVERDLAEAICPRCTAERQEILEREHTRLMFPARLVVNSSRGDNRPAVRHDFPPRNGHRTRTAVWRA